MQNACFHASWLRQCLHALAVAALALLTGCATHFVDGSTREVLPSEYRKSAQAQPVQLIVEFQTKGVANARATGETKEMVAESVRASGLFSQISDAPTAAGNILSVTLNNVPLTDDAAAKGFMTGLTFGAAGSQVTDGYVCTVTYLPAGQGKPVVKSARHAIHTTLGAQSAPASAYKAASIQDAIRMMVRQVMSVALNDLSHDPEFK